MGPGGHSQWPVSISALLDRLSWLVLQTRGLGTVLPWPAFNLAVQKNPGWHPKYFKGSRMARAPPPPIKFLDIGTRMGCYEMGDHTEFPGEDDLLVGEGIPASNAFHSVIYERLGKNSSDVDSWCTEGAWFAHSPQYDFRVKNASVSRMLMDTYGNCQCLSRRPRRSSLHWVLGRNMWTLSLTRCMPHHRT